MTTIVDAHLHVWETGRLDYPWLTDEPDLGRPFLPSALEPGVTSRQVFVQAEASDGFTEAEWVQGLATGWPGLHGIVARLAVEDPGAAEAGLARLERLPLLVGIRRLVQDEAPGFAEDPGFLAGLRLVATHGLPFDACVRHGQLPELIRMVHRVPELTVVLDHLGKPPVAAGIDSVAGRRWLADITRLAENPAVFVKLSGMAPEAAPERPLREQVAPFLVAALSAFGPDRTMVGSDFPVSAHTPHRLGYGEWFEMVERILSLDPDDREQVFSATALAVYRPRA